MWIKLKHYFDKIWGFLKRNWEWFAGFIVMIGTAILLFRSGRVENLMKMFENLNQKRKKDYKDLVKEQQEQHEKGREVLEKYEKARERIELKYFDKRKQLQEEKKKKLKKLAEENRKDPEKFAEDIANEFGIEYVE